MSRQRPPLFQPGDRVRIRGGRGNAWTVIGEETAAWEKEYAYKLDNGDRVRYASEGVLTPVSEAESKPE